MSNHTPGPWIVIDGPYKGIDSFNNQTVIFYGTDSNDGGIRGGWIGEQEANARLIASSPQLLEALMDMVSDRYCLSEATVNFARNVIAKATGADQ